MTKSLHVCVVSGGRADYGLLLPPMRAIQTDPTFRLSLILTGQHLVKEAGDTAARARADGFHIAAELDMELTGDDAASVTHACGRVMDGMADTLASLRPDLLLVLGDRYEILCCVIAATLARIPVAHIAGGDVTEGAFDEGFRHAITKMSHLHFVTNADAAVRVRQMGESDVYVVGSPGLDMIREVRPLPRAEFFAGLGIAPAQTNILVTFHPVTLTQDSLIQFEELLAALDSQSETAIVITGSNADPEGRQIDARAKTFVQASSNRVFIPSLGIERFIAALTHMDIVAGNSSSGLTEAPSFGIPTINIGTRQQGRLKANTVIDTPPWRDHIQLAIKQAKACGRQNTINPYGDGHSSEKIMQVLRTVTNPAMLLQKKSTFGANAI